MKCWQPRSKYAVTCEEKKDVGTVVSPGVLRATHLCGGKVLDEGKHLLPRGLFQGAGSRIAATPHMWLASIRTELVVGAEMEALQADSG